MCYHVLNRGNNQAEIFHSAADYAHFIKLLSVAQERISMEVFAACLMPNHFHIVLRPARGEDLGAWIQWLMTSHVRHYHKKYQSSGRVWQGRFKAFPIQEDRHLLTVMRYVERNALTAQLVGRAEDWQWGSLRWRINSMRKFVISPSPIQLPSQWTEYVNAPQTAAEAKILRECIHRQRPYGETGWVEVTAHALALGSSMRAVGRPRKTQ